MTKPYRYKESGLDNVVLINGFHLEDDDGEGETVTIEAVFLLHERIRAVLLGQAPYLTGRQLFWLRSEIGLSLEELAKDLGVREAILRSYELMAEAKLPNDFEQLFRFYATERLDLSFVRYGRMHDECSDLPYSIRLGLEDGKWVGSVAA